jgi:hypothetical protein
MPTSGPLKFQESGDAAQLIVLARENPELLKVGALKLGALLDFRHSPEPHIAFSETEGGLEQPERGFPALRQAAEKTPVPDLSA